MQEKTGIKVEVEAKKYKAFVNVVGKSTQESRSGKNYFDASKIANADIVVSDNGKTITMPIKTSGNGYSSTSSTLQKLCPNLNVGDTVILYGNTTSNLNRYIYLKSLWHFGTERTITQDDLDSTVILYANRYNDGETEQVTITDMSIMLSTETDTTWEQYGAMPSPEFPSEIKSVGDEGTVTIEQRGKNLINPDKPSPSQTDGGITITNNGDGSYTAKGTSTKALSIQLTSPNIKLKANTYYTHSIEVLEGTMTGSITVAIKKSDDTISYNYMNVNNSNKTNTKISEEDLPIYYYAFYCASGTEVDFTFRVQLEEGEEATDYEPYFSKDYVLQTEPLRSLPNGTKDTIEADGIHRRVGTVVLDGATSITSWGTNDYGYTWFVLKKDVAQDALKNGHRKPYCNIAIGTTNYDYRSYKESLVTQWSDTSASFCMALPKEIVGSSVTTIQSYFQEQYDNRTPVQIQYELAEEVVEPFTDEQQTVLDSIETQKGTNIFSVDSELETSITVIYKGKDENWDSTDIISLKYFNELITNLQTYANRLGIKHNLIEKSNGEFLFSEELDEIDRVLKIISNTLLLNYERKYWYNLSTINYNDWTRWDNQINLIEDKLKDIKVFTYNDEATDVQNTYRKLLYEEV